MNTSPIRWEDGIVRLIDQRKLPAEEVWVTIRDAETMAEAIRSMQIRGAPAIGVATAMGVALAFVRAESELPRHRDRMDLFQRVSRLLLQTRPTAVNLRWALKRMEQVLNRTAEASPRVCVEALVNEALDVQREDIELNRRIGAAGADLFPHPVRILTICNTGSLATAGFGTALGVIRTLWQRGRLVQVYACETRPFLQGARLTMWEIMQDGLPGCLIGDAMAGYLMQLKKVDAVITGADRIAANGDTANKIGTYALAVLAHHHGIPFYVAAPYSTIDLSLSTGEAIPVEERSPDELRRILDVPIAPPDCPVWNPAFDITPGRLIRALITDRGVITPPYSETLRATFQTEHSNPPGNSL